MTHEPPYRDPSLDVEARVEDLLARMSVEDKAGLMFQQMIVVGEDGQLAGPLPGTDLPGTVEAVDDLRMSHFNLLGPAPDARVLAEWHNRLQERAAATPLGIPVTLSTDPRHHFTENLGTAAAAGSFSQWPETLGLAALRDPALVERFADIARQEYTAVGLRAALHPQIDLATEYRWSRISGTFGEDADLTGELVAAYIRGFQGPSIGPDSVSTMTKHFPGGGPQLDGEDPHFPYGREQVYPAGRFEYHLEPFRKALAAGASVQIMPYYGMPIGTELEEVAFAFNRQVITGILREELGFDGIVCTDWGLVSDAVILGEPAVARAWGVEHLDELSRAQRIIEAGCDQFGGEARPDLVVELVRSGRVEEDRIDVSVRRLLREKFRLGLFDDPTSTSSAPPRSWAARTSSPRGRRPSVLPSRCSRTPTPCCRPASDGSGSRDSPRTARPRTPPRRPTWPWSASARPTTSDPARSSGCSTPAPSTSPRRRSSTSANSPRSCRPWSSCYLDRPAITTPLVEAAHAVVVEFGRRRRGDPRRPHGRGRAHGALPFDLPRSSAAVVASPSDAPFSTEDAVFRFGHGLRY